MGKLGDIALLGGVAAVLYLGYKFISDPAGLGSIGAKLGNWFNAPFQQGSVLQNLLGNVPQTATELQTAAAESVPVGTSLFKMESGQVVRLEPGDIEKIEGSMPTGARSFAEKLEWYVAPKIYTKPWTGVIRAPGPIQAPGPIKAVPGTVPQAANLPNANIRLPTGYYKDPISGRVKSMRPS